MVSALELANQSLEVIQISAPSFSVVRVGTEAADLEITPWKAVKRLPESERPDYMHNQVGEIATVQLVCQTRMTKRNFRDLELEAWCAQKNVRSWLSSWHQDMAVTRGFSVTTLADYDGNPVNAYYGIGAISLKDSHPQVSLIELCFGH